MAYKQNGGTVYRNISPDQNVIDVSPGIQHHSPYEVHSRIYECHHGYSVKEEQVSPNIMVILPNIIHQLTSIVEKPWIDLFTTKQSYVSHVPDGRTYSVDALTTHWGGTWAYAYPPHALLPKILSKDYIVLLIAQLSFKLSGSKLCEAYQ